jgi:hypothetical protein
MARLSPNLGLLLIIITAWLNFTMADEPFFHIKSKTTSGNGCPNEHWVEVETTFTTNGTILDLSYMDFTPEISPEQPIQLASSSCQVVLKLDQLRAGYQFAVTTLLHEATGHFDNWEKWTQRFVTDIYYTEGGPVARVGSQSYPHLN